MNAPSTYPLIAFQRQEALILPGSQAMRFVMATHCVFAMRAAVERKCDVILAWIPDGLTEPAALEDLFSVGIRASHDVLLTLADGAVRVRFDALERVKLEALHTKPYPLPESPGKVMEVEVSPLEPSVPAGVDVTRAREALLHKKAAYRVDEAAVRASIASANDPGRLADAAAPLAYHTACAEMLIDLDPVNRLNRLLLELNLGEWLSPAHSPMSPAVVKLIDWADYPMTFERNAEGILRLSVAALMSSQPDNPPELDLGEFLAGRLRLPVVADAPGQWLIGDADASTPSKVLSHLRAISHDGHLPGKAS